jgi:hypothetical protein
MLKVLCVIVSLLAFFFCPLYIGYSDIELHQCYPVEYLYFDHHH